MMLNVLYERFHSSILQDENVDSFIKNAKGTEIHATTGEPDNKK